MNFHKGGPLVGFRFLKKLADIPDLGGFWGEKSNKKTRFRKKYFLTLTGPLVKIGGQNDFFEVISDPHKMILNDFK